MKKPTMTIVEMLVREFKRCRSFKMANASLSTEVWKKLEPSVRRALKNGAKGTVIIGLDLGQTEADAMEGLLRLSKKHACLHCYVFQQLPLGIFHPKVALFSGWGNKQVAIIGSANLSEAACERNAEAVFSTSDPKVTERLENLFHEWQDSDRCHSLTQQRIKNIKVQEKLAKAQARKTKMPKHLLISPRETHKESSLVSIRQLEELAHQLLKSPEGSHADLTLRPRTICRLLSLHKTSKDNLAVRVHPGDTMNQARKLYDSLDMKKIRALDWEVRPNFHLLLRGNHTRFPRREENHPDVNGPWSGRLMKYVQLFQSGTPKIPLKALHRSRLGFDKDLKLYYTYGVLNKNNHSAAIHEKYVVSEYGKTRGYNYIYPCPGLAMEKVLTAKEINNLTKKGLLGQAILESINEVFNTWGQRLRLPGA